MDVSTRRAGGRRSTRACGCASRATGRPDLLWSRPLQHGDEAEGRNRQEPIERAENGRQRVERQHLEEPEGAPAQDFPVEKPGQRSDAVELEQLAHLESAAYGELAQSVRAVPPLVAEHFVE